MFILYVGSPKIAILGRRAWHNVVLELAVMIGWLMHPANGAQPSFSSLRSASYGSSEPACNSIQTTLCLSCNFLPKPPLYGFISNSVFIRFEMSTSIVKESWPYGRVEICTLIHGHRTLKAPHPVRSAQLTRVPPS
jgi:hypothetical protein